jgi:eukaryotic-like serine/threonine-protein kinase
MLARAALTVDDWNRLNRLLEHGLAVPVTARTAWLADLPAESAHLRDVLTQLLADSESTRFAADPEPPTTVARLAAEALSTMRREHVGDRIGPWQLERLLAEGGMGTVWIAQRADGVMQRTAALKLPRAEWVDRGLSERIARERTILARLHHPHIAVLYDAGVTEEGRPYLALEYVEGVPIDAYCRGRESPLAEVLRLMVLIVRAVAYAHSRLVIHRDLKPSNVLVMTDGTPKLLDFGISKLIEGDAPTVDETALTRIAGRPLTLAYAAPEQVLGQPVTVAADVYALGVMLFELASGVRLYRATTPRALEDEILRGDLRRPSEAAPDRARAKALRGDMDAIILTALKRAPEQRYDSATALADDIERCLAGEPVRARPDSRVYRLGKFVTRNRVPVAAGSVVVLALAAGLGVALWQASQARQQAEEARNQAQRATALNTFVLSLIQQADPNASAQTKAADHAMLTAIEQRIDAEFKGSPAQLLQLRVTVGDAYRNRGEMMAARRVFKRAIDEATPHIPKDDLRLLRARVQAADFNLIVSLESAADLDRIIEQLRPMGREGADLLIDALMKKEQLRSRFGIPEAPSDEAVRNSLVEALDLATRHFGEGSRQQLKVASRHAALIAKVPLDPRSDGRPEALALLERVLDHARRRTDFVESSAEYLDALGSYGAWLCNSKGREYEGLRVLWNVAGKVREAYGPSALQLELPLGYLAACLNNLGDPAAEGFPIMAYEVAAARERPPTSNLMRRAEFVFIELVGRRRLEQARSYYDEAMKNSAAFPEDSLRDKYIARLQPSLYVMLARTGKSEEAEALAAPAIAEFDARQSALFLPQAVPARLGLSFAQRENGHFEAAIGTALRLEALCQKRIWNWCITDARVARAAAQLDAGDAAAAIESAEQALEHRQQFWFSPPAADLGVIVGRARLANGRAQDALEPLRQAYGFWLGHDPYSAWAAEAEYWFGKAWIANGEAKRGRWMVAQARQELAKSPVASHRALARQP